MFLLHVPANRELMTLNYSHSFTWLPWTPLRPALCGGSVVLTTCASHKLRPSEWREPSVPSSHPDSRISTALSVKGTETDFPSSTWRYDGFLFLKKQSRFRRFDGVGSVYLDHQPQWICSSSDLLGHQDEVLFDSWDAIFNEGGIKDNVPIYSFDGRDVLSDGAWWWQQQSKISQTSEVGKKWKEIKLFVSRPEKLLWHGSTGAGQRHTEDFCEAWRSGNQAQTGMAAPLQAGSNLLQQRPGRCSSAYAVLCIENSYIGHAKK